MTIFEEGIFSLLSSFETAAGTRIWPNVLPQGEPMPAIKYFLVSDPPMRSHSGPGTTARPRYQLDCYAATYEEAKALAQDIMYRLEGYTGNFGNIPGYVSFVEDARDNYDPDTARHWVSIDVMLWHRRP